jgi:hypothetical protein
MTPQNYANHRRFVTGYHIVLFFLLLLCFGGAITNVVQSWGDHQRIYSATLILAVVVALLILFFYARLFPLRAQDRAIRAEENFRHYLLTGKPLDSRLSIRQIIGLRFADDAEFVELAKRAVSDNLSEEDIKKQIRTWRADDYRV